MTTKTLIPCLTAPLRNRPQLAEGRWDQCRPGHAELLRPPQQPAVRPYRSVPACNAKSILTRLHTTTRRLAINHQSLLTSNWSRARTQSATSDESDQLRSHVTGGMQAEVSDRTAEDNWRNPVDTKPGNNQLRVPELEKPEDVKTVVNHP